MKAINTALEKRTVFTKALFTRPKSLATLLPYDEVLEKDRLFVLKDGSIGAIYNVELIEHEALTSRRVIEHVNGFLPLFTLPKNCTLQFLFNQEAISHFDKQIKNLEKEHPDAHPTAKALFAEKLEALKAKSPLRRSLFISVRYFPQKRPKRKTIQSYLQEDYGALQNEFSEFVSELRNFKSTLKTLEMASSLSLTRIGGKELLDKLRQFFNPQAYYKRSFAPFNPRAPLSKQFLYHSPQLDYSGIEREGVKSRTLTLKTCPLYAYPGGMAYFLKIPFPFRIALNFSFPSKAKTKLFFDTKEFFLENGLSAKARIQREDIKQIQDRLARNDRCMNLTFSIIIEGNNEEELDSRENEICHIFSHELEAEIIKEDSIGLGLAINSLPLCYTPDADYSTKRAIKIFRSDAVKFLPIFDSFRGHARGSSLYLSRESNIVPFNLLSNETSNHTAILADTGSGKSTFVADSLAMAKRVSPEPLIFIIDKKSSYAELAKQFNGELIVFDHNTNCTFSPFRGKYNEEKIAFLTKIIISAIHLSSPSFQVESEHQDAITKALKSAYLKKCDREGLKYENGKFIRSNKSNETELTMDDFIVELGSLAIDNIRSTVDPLLQKLRPFYGDGIYAKFFRNTERNSKKDSGLYIYDLDALDNDPILQTLMTMAVIEEIRRIISLPQNQGRTGFLVMEEFAMLGRNNPKFRDFAIDFAETMRKRGCWLITLTPRPQNYFDTEVGKAFWSVASNYIFLQMNADNVDYIIEKSSLLDEATGDIVRSLRTIRGQYAEVFYTDKNKTRQGAFRHCQS